MTMTGEWMNMMSPVDYDVTMMSPVDYDVAMMSWLIMMSP